jgi:hypothetical protein
MSPYDDLLKQFHVLEEIQRVGYRMLARRALMMGVLGDSVRCGPELQALGHASVFHEHAMLLAESEDGLSERGAKRVAQILRHGIPAAAQPMLAAPLHHGQAALPAYSGAAELDESDEGGALARRIDNVTSMMQHLLERTGDSGDDYEEVAAFVGRKL